MLPKFPAMFDFLNLQQESSARQVTVGYPDHPRLGIRNVELCRNLSFHEYSVAMIRMTQELLHTVDIAPTSACITFICQHMDKSHE
ncbi:hypothetical protein PoB_002567000 [Plakobranchus ocellatus]|uniref:Uncharacterized protein n=1 Tax=Plakobranchus ocellatus TaxID=259542 RepID=A0AAV3ZVF3_9GAST|nr:hypothetical protein PoB_002567000 [Plakobranchus ocellatus]